MAVLHFCGIWHVEVDQKRMKMTARNHQGLARVEPRLRTIYCSQGRAVLATDLDGQIVDDPRHGLFVGETRVISRYRYLLNGNVPQPVALSNAEQHSWLGYYVTVPSKSSWPKDSGSGQM